MSVFSPIRGRITRWVLFACVCALSTLMSHRITAQSGTGDTPFSPRRRRRGRSTTWHSGLPTPEAQTRREAAARLARFPDSVNTVAWLAHAGRTGDALDVLQRVIARHPTRIADGLEALAPVVSTLQRNQASEYQARLTGSAGRGPCAASRARSRVRGTARPADDPA